MRVNARLDEESQQQIDYLTAATGKAVSHVLRESVSFYYRHVRAQRSGIEHLAALIGKGDSGRSDIASNVKRQFAESASAKQRVSGASAPLVVAKAKPVAKTTPVRAVRASRSPRR